MTVSYKGNQRIQYKLPGCPTANTWEAGTMWTDTEHRYGLVTKLLHWAAAVLVPVLVWLGWNMAGPNRFDRRSPVSRPPYPAASRSRAGTSPRWSLGCAR